MQADRSPLASNVATPSMVVPPGEVTASFNCPGCLPVSSTIFAAPCTVCAASCVATFRGRPAATPPSDSASMNMYTYAGPLPLSPVTASSSRSSTEYAMPTLSKRLLMTSMSSLVALAPRAKAEAEQPTIHGVLGMTRTTWTLVVSASAAAASVASVTPAAMETSTCVGFSKDLTSDSTFWIMWGFTAKMMMSELDTTSRLLEQTLI
mmetsp:Transcript_74488/g.125495  ORF Transcript_74488/g.125495 Transcript_74488/m.125495 type:complete len:207 (-) Transcript_74488:178-798(-)